MRVSSKRAVPLLLAVTGLVPLIWMRDDLPTKGVDSFFSLHPTGFAKASLYAWDARTSGGVANADVTSYLLNSITSLSAQAGLSLVEGQLLVLCFLSITSILGMYFLILNLLPSQSASEFALRLTAACGALIWVVNPFALGFVYWHQLHIEATWALLPWLLLVLARLTKQTISKTAAAGRLLLLSLVGAVGLPQVYLPGVFLICVLVVIACAAPLPSFRKGLQRGAGGILVLLVSLMWWLIPSLPQVGALNQAAQVESSSLTQFEYASMYSHVGQVLSLTALPELHVSTPYSPFISWSNLINSSPGVYIKYLLPTLALLGLLIPADARTRRVPAILGLTALFGIALSKADNAPFAFVNRAILHLPLGDAFRHPVDKFSFVLLPPLVILASFGLITCLRERGGGLVAFFLALLVIVFMGSPWWTGGVIPKGGPGVPSAHVSLPTSYNQVGHWMSGLSAGGKTQVEPFSYDGQEAFSWASGVQSNLDPLLQDWAPTRSLLARASGLPLADRVAEVVDGAVSRQDPRVFPYARLAGVDSWLVHKDWRGDLFPTPTSADGALAFFDSSVSRSFGIRQQIHSPELTAYGSVAMPVLYAATSEVTIGGSDTTEQILNAAAKTEKQPSPVMLTDLVPAGSLDPDAHLSERLISPTTALGTLAVHGSTWLVFNQTFDPSWHIDIGGATVKAHAIANSFGNAWQVAGNGNFSFRITYAPQKYYDAGLLVALAQMLVGSALVSGVTTRTRRRARRTPAQLSNDERQEITSPAS